MSDLTAVSLFAGIGGFDEAMRRAGVHVAAAVEIDEGCRGNLRRHFPETKLFNDVTEVTGDQLRAAGFVPGRGILCGGWPCQDLSVAGRRAGLGGARSGLFWEVVRLAGELRPRWLLLENVPGLLSAVCPCPGDDSCARAGRAVRCGRWEKRNGIRRFIPHVRHTPKGGVCLYGCMETHGGAMGAVVGALERLGYGLCWRVLDAQYFGVPQRRDRVFFAGCLGDGAAPVEVLLEPESGEGNPAARGTARPGTARAPGVGAVSALQGGGRRGHRIDAEGAAGGQLIAFDAAQITSGENRANPRPGDPTPTLADPGQPMLAYPIVPRGRDGGSQIEAAGPGEPAFTVRTPGGGSSVPMVSAPITSREARRSVDSDCTNGVIVTPVAHAVTSSMQRQDGLVETLIAHALTSEGADASEDGTGRGTPLVAVPLAWRGRGQEVGEDNIAYAIRSGGDGHTGDQMGYVMSLAVAGDFSASEGVAQTVRSAHGQPGNVGDAQAVRRLTPLECERLQGFSDEWTRWDANGIEQSDSARYRRLGNAVAVPVVEWIARRIVAAEVSLIAANEGAA